MSESKLPLKFARWQRQRLPRQPSRARDARVHRRTWAILDGDRGESASHIARGPEVTRQSGHNRTAADAEAAEPESRVDDARPGRPAPWAEDVRAAFRALPEQTPDRLGYFAVNWAVPLFRDALAEHAGRRPSEDTIRRELDRLGYVWKRSRHVLDPDPEREKKTPHPHGDPGPAAARRRVG
jgi:hypothetical protein